MGEWEWDFAARFPWGEGPPTHTHTSYSPTLWHYFNEAVYLSCTYIPLWQHVLHISNGFIGGENDTGFKTRRAPVWCVCWHFFQANGRIFILTKSLRIHIFSFEWLRHRRLREECRLVYVVKRLSEGRKPSRSSLSLSLSFSVSLTTRLESQLQIISSTTPATKLRGHLHGNRFFCSRTFS